MTMSSKLEVRMDGRDKKKIKRAARSRNQTASEWARSVLLDAAKGVAA